MVKAGDGVLQELGLSGAEERLVMGTGVIAQHLPIDGIVNGVADIAPTLGIHAHAAAYAFMITDTSPKLRSRTFALVDRTYRIARIDKNAGITHPRMLHPRPCTPHSSPRSSLTPSSPRRASVRIHPRRPSLLQRHFHQRQSQR
ncbi:hypothetical protein PLICRDRAFT_51255 [Plicaturopsis crispa FD-325 SS-3]|nr:hypothetical protein PLICRDRAFT_51255 [Plicaturopsis crispa FD-325 SS-3]